MLLMAVNRQNKAKKVILWGAWYGSRNIGDQLLLLMICELLDDTLDEVEYVVLTDDQEHVNDYTSRETTSFVTGLVARAQLLKIVKEVFGADIFIFGGGVPFFRQTKHLLAMVFLVTICKLGRTPYMTWSVSSQPVTSIMAKKVFGWILKGAAAITYRDLHTRVLFESCGVKHPMLLTADSAFNLQYRQSQFALEQLSRAGLRHTDRPLIAMTPRTLVGAENVSGIHYSEQSISDYERELECFSALVDWCWEHGYQAIFIPMNSSGDDDDRIAAKACMKRSKHGMRTLLIDGEIRPKDASTLYRQCAAGFVARVHGSITAFIAECPVMMYAFQPKHKGIMESMGLQAYSMEAETASPQIAIKMFQQLLASRESVVAEMRIKNEELRDSARIPARLAKQILEGNVND